MAQLYEAPTCGYVWDQAVQKVLHDNKTPNFQLLQSGSASFTE